MLAFLLLFLPTNIKFNFMLKKKEKTKIVFMFISFLGLLVQSFFKISRKKRALMCKIATFLHKCSPQVIIIFVAMSASFRYQDCSNKFHSNTNHITKFVYELSKIYILLQKNVVILFKFSLHNLYLKELFFSGLSAWSKVGEIWQICG